MSEFTKVHCKIPNGVVLRTFEKSEGPFGVISYLVNETVTINGGINDVETGFFDRWMEANSDSDLIKDKFIERKS